VNFEKIKTYNFEFEQVIPNKDYIENLLLKEFPSEIKSEYFPNMFSLLKQKSQIKAGYVWFNPNEVKVSYNVIKVKDKIFDIGKIILRGIKETESLFIITCTIGEKVEKSIWKFFNDGNSLEGYILDKMASELVELTADYLQSIIERQAIVSGQSISNRYSPGYCGWAVSEQQKLFSLLPENFCGIKLTPSSLMIPIKSISGIIAVGKNITKKEYECEICDDNFCYKKRVQ